jgi:phosphoglycolate phosphatase-like HAD superfamily hydrolase
MGGTAPYAVIFDIDGVLLHLTRAEEKLFFDAFRATHHIDENHLNPNWNSYRVRNDLSIAEELLERQFGRLPSDEEIDAVMRRYVGTISSGLDEGSLTVRAIDGAKNLLDRLRRHGTFTLGLATANIKGAAEIRLRNAGLWGYYDVAGYAEAKGPKINILRDAIRQLQERSDAPISPDRIVYLGDQLGDLEAAGENGVPFIGTSPRAEQRQILRDNGAEDVADGHHETEAMILRLLRLDG